MEIEDKCLFLILFGDLIGSTEVASEVTPRFFSKVYVNSFRLAAECAFEYIKDKDVTKNEFPLEAIIEDYTIRGDEILSFTPLNYSLYEKRMDSKEISKIASAIAFAFVLKLYWFMSPYNMRRLIGKQFPRDIAVGIHIGPAEYIQTDREKEIAGLHINIAKRLETAARTGSHSRIFASDDVDYFFTEWCKRKGKRGIKRAMPLLYTIFKKALPIDLKGIPVRVSPFELQLDERDQDKMEGLFTLMYTSPDKENAVIEHAIKVLITKFFNALKEDKNKILTEEIKNFSDPKIYIEQWFSAINCLPMLWSDIWTNLITFLLSCGFLRSDHLSHEQKSRYLAIIKNLSRQLENLIQRSKTQIFSGKPRIKNIPPKRTKSIRRNILKA